jgi:hypothetical protein
MTISKTHGRLTKVAGGQVEREREREDGRLKNKVAFTNKLHNTNMEEKRDFTR